LQTDKTFHLAFLDADMLAYAGIMLALAVVVCLIATKRVEKRNARFLVYGFALLFAASVLLPALAPLWTKVKIEGAHLRIEGLTFNSEVELASIRLESAVVLSHLPDSLAIKSPRGGVSFSNLSFGWFMLMNNRPSLRYVTSSSGFAVFTTSEQYTVILTLDEPEQFIAQIKSLH
jgi:hypothetical protein